MGGGYIGNPGSRGADTVPTVMAPGEVWLTRHMLTLIERANPGALDGKIVHVIDEQEEGD
jgi:hypothetical protein